MKNSTTWLKSRYFASGVLPDGTKESITDRQEKVPGFKQSVMDTLCVLQIGAGGLGGEIAQGLVRKGIGKLMIFDGDTVELSNLSRQLFYKDDLYKNKAICLAKNLVKEGIKRTNIEAYPCMFQKVTENKIDIKCNMIVCAPDNDDTRVYVAKLFYKTVPVIFVGLDRQASTGYIFIQKPNGPCVVCALPRTIENKREHCPNVAAIIDLVKIIAGYVLFAIDSVVMERKSNWNFRQFFIAGFAPDIVRMVDKKKDCPLCRTAKRQHK
jgi:molybdopterin/thiamine biosynthesis adenylyltransferase